MKLIFAAVVLMGSFIQNTKADSLRCQDAVVDCRYVCPAYHSAPCKVIRGNCAAPTIITYAAIPHQSYVFGIFSGEVPDMICRFSAGRFVLPNPYISEPRVRCHSSRDCGNGEHCLRGICEVTGAQYCSNNNDCVGAEKCINRVCR